MTNGQFKKWSKNDRETEKNTRTLLPPKTKFSRAFTHIYEEKTDKFHEQRLRKGIEVIAQVNV